MFATYSHKHDFLRASGVANRHGHVHESKKRVGSMMLEPTKEDDYHSAGEACEVPPARHLLVLLERLRFDFAAAAQSCVARGPALAGTEAGRRRRTLSLRA